MNKSELRLTLRAARKDFVQTRGGNEFCPIHVRNCLIPLISQSTIIAFYQSSVTECSLNFLANMIFKELVLPCANSKGDRLIFRSWSSGDPLETSPLGFRQPVSTALAKQPDLILTPLLGFDRALNRLGQGAGHYDRAFEDFPDAIRVGVAWSVQEVSSLTPDLWDVPLDAVLTEREWITSTISRMDKQI